jgi:aminoglycoside/choline kinase family phosphotransferase
MATDFVESSLELSNVPVTLSLLAGDASSREFYRVEGAPEPYLLMTGPDYSENMKYYTFGRLLNEAGLAFPKLVEIDRSMMFVLMEDLGDLRLDKALESESKEDVRRYYLKAARALAIFHKKAYKNIGIAKEVLPDPYSPVFALKKEINYFLKGLGLIGFPYRKGRAIFVETMMYAILLDSFIRKRNKVLIHRDFQSRNIMIKEGSPFFIDWQGAMQGPFQYDLASLIYDPYVDLSEDLKDEILQSYLNSSATRTSLSKLKNEVMVFGVVRLFQAFGAYAKLSVKLGKSQYKPYLKVAAKRLNSIFSNKYFENFVKLGDLVSSLDAFFREDS